MYTRNFELTPTIGSAYDSMVRIRTRAVRARWQVVQRGKIVRSASRDGVSDDTRLQHVAHGGWSRQQQMRRGFQGSFQMLNQMLGSAARQRNILQ